MALGAITVQPIDQHVPGSPQGVSVGSLKMTVTNIVGDSAYASGGSALTPSQLGLTTVVATQAEVTGSASNNGGSTAFYNIGTGKLQMYTTGATGALVECGAVNLSGLTIQIMAFGY